jgi:hypothetical protein
MSADDHLGVGVLFGEDGRAAFLLLHPGCYGAEELAAAVLLLKGGEAASLLIGERQVPLAAIKAESRRALAAAEWAFVGEARPDGVADSVPLERRMVG